MFGKPVFIGDEVAINPPSYKGLVKANVVKFTPKGFTVTYRHQGHLRQTTVFELVKHVYGDSLSIGNNDGMS